METSNHEKYFTINDVTGYAGINEDKIVEILCNAEPENLFISYGGKMLITENGLKYIMKNSGYSLIDDSWQQAS